MSRWVLLTRSLSPRLRNNHCFSEKTRRQQQHLGWHAHYEQLLAVSQAQWVCLSTRLSLIEGRRSHLLGSTAGISDQLQGNGRISMRGSVKLLIWSSLGRHGQDTYVSRLVYYQTWSPRQRIFCIPWWNVACQLYRSPTVCLAVNSMSPSMFNTSWFAMTLS